MRVDFHLKRDFRRESHKQINERLAFGAAIETDRAIWLTRNHVHVEYATNSRCWHGFFFDERAASNESCFFAGESDEHNSNVQCIVFQCFRHCDHAADTARVVIGSVVDLVFIVACGRLRRQVIEVRGDQKKLTAWICSARRNPRNDIRRSCRHATNWNEHRFAPIRAFDERLCTGCCKFFCNPLRSTLSFFASKRATVELIGGKCGDVCTNRRSVDRRNGRGGRRRRSVRSCLRMRERANRLLCNEHDGACDERANEREDTVQLHTHSVLASWSRASVVDVRRLTA